MPLTELLFLALALSMDAIIVCFSFGLAVREKRMKAAFGLALATGLGQMIMPLGGYFLTGGLVNYIRECDHWIAFAVFSALGLKVIWDAFTLQEEDESGVALSFKTFFMVGLATSIDAFVAGTMIYLTGSRPFLSAGLIGLVTFIFALTGFLLSKVLHHLPTRWMQLSAGLVLIGLGVKVLMEHLCE